MRVRVALGVGLICWWASSLVRADDEFAAHVLPVLRRHCTACHGPDKQEGMLRLDDVGRDFSAPRQAARWRDVADRVRSGEMPPADQPRLSDAETKSVLNWIARRLDAAPAARSHWAFQPLSQTSPPVSASLHAWIRNDVDRYIVVRREQLTGAPDLAPSREAERTTLLRRITFDLIGLPPTPEEIAAFEADDAPDAWERVVDRLLASPHYGERWGRHWLDLAQYADSSGFHNDLDRPHAWKYRDYVIRSFNADKPYGRFVAEQLAGDEVDEANDETLIATGFCRNGPSNDDNMGKTPEALAQYRADQLDNVVSTTGTVFLGLTIGCARCHNHKTEPLSSRDYYSLVAIFNGTQKQGIVPGTEDAAGKKVAVDPLVTIQALVERSAQVPPTFVLRRGSAAQPGDEVTPAVPAILAARPVEFPRPAPSARSSLRRRTLAEWIVAPNNPLAWRVLANRVWQHHFGRGLVATPSNFGVSGAAPSHPELLDRLARLLLEQEGRVKPLHRLLVTSATYRQASDHRADAAQLDPSNVHLWRMNLRRLEAEALRDAMLAASDNLQRRLGGPGIKPRIRADLLTASQRNKWPVLARESHPQWRRSVYIYSKRQLLMPLMELFDAPTTTDSCPERLVSVVPTQALVLMNDEFTEDQAEALAALAERERGAEPRQAVEFVFRRTLGRAPDAERLREAERFVAERTLVSDRLSALADLVHVIFNSSEFLYVE